MAALLALSLYMEMPRWRSKRSGRKTVAGRARRAVQARHQALRQPERIGRWPAKIEDLENTNNRRFLRHRFKDPFTGKDEWRLVHIQVAC